MKSKYVVLLLLVAILGLSLGFYYVFVKPYLPKYNWTETCSYKSAEPYGTKLLFDVLNDSPRNKGVRLIKKSVVEQLPLNAANAVYVFIGRNLLADSLSTAHIFNFAAKGNDVFLSTATAPVQFFNHLIDTHYVEYSGMPASQIKLNFVDSPKSNGYAFHYKRLKDTIVNNWMCVDSARFSKTLSYQGFTPLALNDSGGVVLMKCKYGKGFIYFHTIPVLFCNYNFAKQEGFRYAVACFEPFAGRSIYWDEISKEFVYDPQVDFQPSPLRFIFTHRGLKWAWYALLISTLLFILFRSKRVQRIIPILAPVKNTSAEFCTGVAQLYLQAKNHNHIAPEMFKLFAVMVKSKYGITIKPDNKERCIPELALKSGINELRIKRLFELQVAVQFGDGSDNEVLMNLYSEFQYFYKNCR